MGNLMLPKALIVHQIRDRVRLRINERKDDPEFFEQIRDQLVSISVIKEVEINSTTASILLLHPSSHWSEVETKLRELKLFEIVKHIEQDPALSHLMSSVSKIEKRISDFSSGSIDLRTLAFIILSGLALRQIVRGEILGPGIPLLWSAMGLVRFMANSEDNT